MCGPCAAALPVRRATSSSRMPRIPIRVSSANPLSRSLTSDRLLRYQTRRLAEAVEAQR
jgi:hypothetical protein